MRKCLLIFICLFSSYFSLAQSHYSIFLLGDAGEPQISTDPVLKALQNQLQKSDKNAALILLGDNIYPKGLPDSDHPSRSEAERRLTSQLNLLKNFAGRGFVIPGNHDWQKGGRKGWISVQEQAKFTEEFLEREGVFVPEGGCPGPVEVSLNEQLTLVLFDSQWFLHPWDKPGEESSCEVKDLASFLTAMEDALERNRNRQVVVIGHHPMYSHGEHGGYFTLKDHLFPLTAANKSLYVPLPVIGSIYPLYRSLIGNIQDIQHPHYKQMRDGLVALFRQYPNVMYANGHDHNLQLIEQEGIHYVTSGSGSKNSPVKKGKNSLFAASKKGFTRLDFVDNQAVRITFYEPSADKPEGNVLYQTEILLKPKPEPLLTEGNEQKTITSVSPSLQYQSGRFNRFLLGNNYREVWATPIDVPMLNLQQEKGGLKVIQRGGGQQTLSLRYQAADGKQYVTRSIEKYAINAVPEAIRSAFVANLVQDQISSAHPFSALVVAPLAEVAGVYHTNPRLVIIPNDTTLGKYRKLFAGQLALFEERAEDGFQGIKKVYSTDKMLMVLQKGHNNQVDQQAVLRARLFDIFLSDWDRHDDQWRWASIKSDKGLVFRPIPRDRDQAFFVNQGLIPKIISRKWILPKVQGFDYTIRDIPGLGFNARYFDRSFLTNVERQDWLTMADTLKTKLTDAVIENAVRQMPASAYERTGETIIAKLKRRREDLSKYAELQYRFLAKGVNVVGSDQPERFEITRQPDGQTEVKVYELGKKGQTGEMLYHRTFLADETKEIHLYGLGDDDQFVIEGQAQKSSLLRIIGGKGKDEITDHSSVAGLSRKTIVYDLKKNTILNAGSETQNRLSDDPKVNEYDRKDFKYNLVMPLLSVQYNPDDGVFLGGGVLYKKQGFRREPFKSQHRVTANHAFDTEAYNFRYDGDFTDAIGRLDLALNAEIKAPNFVYNFFGLGNKSVFNKDQKINYYRTRFKNWKINALLQHKIGQLTFFVGPAFENIDVEQTPNKYINVYAAQQPDEQRIFEQKSYFGLKMGYTLDNRDSKVLTTRGIYWKADATFYQGISDQTKNLSQIQSELAFYTSFRLPARLILATRFGGGWNLSDYEFFQANTLSGLTNLRGFRRNRFAGKSSFYNNTETRLKVLTIKTYLFPAYVGILGFYDTGRVWYEGEKSKQWHHGYGGGVWIAPFNQAIISANYAISKEDKLFLVRVGWFF